MPKLNLKPVDRHEDISREDFRNNYLFKNKPLVMKNYSKNWNAASQWSLEYFKSKYGHIEVPLFSEAFANTGQSYLDSQSKMNFGDYLDLIATKPTKKRMFLFNIFKYAPELCNDFDYPKFVNFYLKKYPFMFFGGETSYVDAHMDLDLSHVFITQFQGEKKVILFDPKHSVQLYRHPFTVSTNIDIGNPDFSNYPLLDNLEGYECVINNGDTLFMPSGYWHYIYYIEGGFALSLRSSPENIFKRIQGAYSIAKLLACDRLLTKIFGGENWYAKKESWAHKRAEKLGQLRK